MIGDVISNRYEILEKLAGSAIFESYLARDRFRSMEICLRMVNHPFTDQTEFIRMLASVVERAELLDHPNIARVYGMGDHNGRQYFVCEALKGSNLVERIRRIAPFSPPVACEIGIGICEALEHAALRGLPHGDLCADHVLTNLEGRVAVIDFGLWESYSRSSTAGAMVLSRMAPYLAPEVIDGQLPSPSSDVYAVGVILFELVTARLPFSGETPGVILAKHTTEVPPSARSLNSAVPAYLDEIISKSLAKDRGARYPSATELLADLRAVKDGLRFGKQLSWPIGSEPVAAAVTNAPPPLRAPSAYSLPSARQKAKGRDKNYPEDDVPGWLKAVVYVLGGMAFALVIGWMILNVTKKKELELPNLVGLTVAEARERAKATGFNVAVEREEYNEKFPQPDTIISMDPAPKTHVREGGYVRVIRSLGSAHVDVPDLRGVPVDEAKRRLTAAGLRVAEKVDQQINSNFEIGTVVKSDPGRGERVDRKTTIELTVSGERKTPDRKVEEGLVPNAFTLRFRVKDSNDFVAVRVEMTDAADERRVVFEEPRPGGDYVEIENIEGKGKDATFRIYFDDYLWRTRKLEGNMTGTFEEGR
ncbi:MAG: PASTA domain-containing protein [Fimbriimonadales bacterium]